MLKFSQIVSLSFLAFGLPCLAAAQYPLAKEQVLHIGNGAEPKELDPARATGAIEGQIINNLFEGLTSVDPYENDPVPGMAESWTISTDGLTYIFKIRKDAKWSDGKDLTADDFVYSWQRALAPKTASEYAYQLFYIKNGKEINEGKKKPETLAAKAIDRNTLEVKLDSPTPFFLHLTAFQTLMPTPKHIVEKYNDTWTAEGKMVSNGPFKLSEAKLNQHIKVIPNNFYWDKNNVKLKAIYFYPTENKNTEEKSFKTGKLHITSTVPSLLIPEYESQAKKDPKNPGPFRVAPLFASFYLRLNTKRKPFDDPRVRRALAITIDRKQIVERVTRGGKIPATSFTPHIGAYTFKGSLPASVNEAVIKEAKSLLAQAGYPNGANMPKIDLLYNTDEDNKRIVVAIQQMWHKNLGIQVGLFNQEWKVYLDSITNMNYDIARSRWIGDYPDVNTFLDLFVTNGGNNETGWSNKKYDEYVHLASLANNQNERFALFEKAETILMNELPLIPIFTYTNVKLVANSVKMFNPKSKEITEWKSDIMDRIFCKYYVLVEDHNAKES